MKKILIIFIVCFIFTLVGCASVNRAIDNYKACQGDVDCLREMNNVKEVSYEVTRATSSSLPVPSLPEAIAYVVSNACAFGFGVLKGKRKKG